MDIHLAGLPTASLDPKVIFRESALDQLRSVGTVIRVMQLKCFRRAERFEVFLELKVDNSKQDIGKN